MRILVVCYANVCRSPLAAAVLRELLPAESNTTISSAGINAIDGAPACELANQSFSASPTSLRSHQSRQIDQSLIEHSDLILTMSPEQSRWIIEHWPDTKLKTFGLVESATKMSLLFSDLSTRPADWSESLAQDLDSMRGLVSVPRLPNPKGRWMRRLEPGRLADGHNLSRSAHLRTLRQVIIHAQMLGGSHNAPTS